MKLGIVSDIHCNAAGLRTAIDLMGDIDELICLGDSIWEYRFSNEVVALLRERAAHTILGNHEEGFLGPLGERARARPGTDPDLLDWLATRPHRVKLDCGSKRVLLVHSTPWEPRGAYIHPGDALLARFAEADADFVLYGHTHRQVVKRFGDVLVINPGSAGDARDHGNGRQLSCAVLDTASEEVRVIDFPGSAMNTLVNTKPGSHFEDYPVGAVFTGGPITVTEQEILDFARRYDPQPMHVNKEAAEAGPYGGLIASGWHTGAMMMQLLAAHFVPKPGNLASPGLDELRWLKPVRPGDRLSLRATVLSARPSRSKPDQGVVTGLVELINQNGETVLSLKPISLMRRRNPGPP